MNHILKNSISMLLIVTVISVTFSGCKKGEDDPFLSLRSRKARVVGDWKVISYKYTDVSVSPTLGTTTYTTVMNGSTYTTTQTDVSGTTTSTGTWTSEYKFDKKGEFTWTDNRDADLYSVSGTWNFTSGVGELKNKSQLTLYGQSITGGGNSSTYTGNYVDIAYDIQELRNKKMVWVMKISNTESSGSSYTSEEEIVLEPK